MHGDLIISRISIHEAKKLVSRGHIHEFINSWEWKVVLGASFVEVGKIDVGSSLAVGLLYQDRVC